MEPEELLENEAGLDADPIATLEQELQGADENAAAREKIDFLHRCAQLLAQAPLGSVDVYAKSFR